MGNYFRSMISPGDFTCPASKQTLSISDFKSALYEYWTYGWAVVLRITNSNKNYWYIRLLIIYCKWYVLYICTRIFYAFRALIACWIWFFFFLLVICAAYVFVCYLPVEGKFNHMGIIWQVELLCTLAWSSTLHNELCW